jgi:carboxypeptidase T
VLWPYGCIYSNSATGMSAEQYNTFVTMGRAMAGTNGYTPEQASDLYIADGTLPDWAWGTHRVFAFRPGRLPLPGDRAAGAVLRLRR